MKSALLDAVTHDLMTPLTSIRAAASTLRKAERTGQTLDPELNGELIELVDEESFHLDQIISGFMELARIEAGDLPGIGMVVIDGVVSAQRSRTRTASSCGSIIAPASRARTICTNGQRGGVVPRSRQ